MNIEKLNDPAQNTPVHTKLFASTKKKKNTEWNKIRFII